MVRLNELFSDMDPKEFPEDKILDVGDFLGKEVSFLYNRKIIAGQLIRKSNLYYFKPKDKEDLVDVSASLENGVVLINGVVVPTFQRHRFNEKGEYVNKKDLSPKEQAIYKHEESEAKRNFQLESQKDFILGKDFSNGQYHFKRDDLEKYNGSFNKFYPFEEDSD